MEKFRDRDQQGWVFPKIEGADGIVFGSVEETILPAGVSLVMPQQTHTVNVGVVTSPDEAFPETDALITQLPGVAVGVRTADCVPVLLYAPDIRAVAAVHAGWKGTVGRIVANTVRKLEEMGAGAGAIRAVFGPSICGECYETGDDLAQRFTEAGLAEAVVVGPGLDPLGKKQFGESTVRIDLQKANKLIMMECGMQESNIYVTSECTRHSPRHWPSWRRCHGTAKRLVSLIYLVKHKGMCPDEVIVAVNHF